MFKMREIRVWALNFLFVLTMLLGCNAFSQVTVNAPKGLLNREKPSTNTKAAKEKPKVQEPVKKPESKSIGDSWTEFQNSDSEKNDTKTQPRKRKTISDSDRKSYRFSNQTVVNRVGGYRIQVLFSSSKQARTVARKRAKEFALEFPQYRSYISYNAPQWRLRIGDFKTKGEAKKALARLRRSFRKYSREMLIVHDTINVWGNY